MLVNGTGCPSTKSPVVPLLGLYCSLPRYVTFTSNVPFVSISNFTRTGSPFIVTGIVS